MKKCGDVVVDVELDVDVVLCFRQFLSVLDAFVQGCVPDSDQPSDDLDAAQTQGKRSDAR